MSAEPEIINTSRLTLEPLRAAHAPEMAAVLSDPAMYAFTGGTPPTADELSTRYARQVIGRSADGRETWLNWVARERSTGAAVGTVQATVKGGGATSEAEVAWVIGAGHQRQGYAREGAAAMMTWLRQNRCDVVVAHIHPDHVGSQAVARALGLRPTDEVVDGEVRWVSGR